MTDEELTALVEERVRAIIALDQTRAKLGVGVKLSKALADLEGVPKLGRNTHFNYDYRRADDVANAVRKVLGKHGLVIVPHMQRIEHHTRPLVDQNGEIQRNPDGSTIEVTSGMHTAHFVMQVIDGEGGGALEVQWQSEAQDTQDKGTGKAVTAALKSFLIALFLIGDDEGDLEDDRHTRPQAASAPQAATERAAPARAPRQAARTQQRREEGTGADGKLTAREIKEILDKKDELGLTGQQLGWVVKSNNGGQVKSGLLKHVLQDRKAHVIAGLEYVKAEILKQEEERLSDPELGAVNQMPDLEPQEAIDAESASACTCGAGVDSPAEQHDESCDMSIPF